MASSFKSAPLSSRRSKDLRGVARIPGDKSISHRALILAAMAVGESRITGLLEADDVLNTATAMRKLGADIERDQDGVWHAWGRGIGGFSQPDDVLDFGNSGTGSRLVMGALATSPVTAVFTGDASLRKRPMARVLIPLSKFGACYSARDGEFMPLTLEGAARAIAIDHEVEVPSAQVKSALLLAALNAPGISRITQKVLTRDHTEKMLKGFGAEISVDVLDDGGERISIAGEQELRPCTVEVPADPSSAAFAVVAGAIVPGSEITVPSVLLNPRRTGLYTTLQEMGAKLSVSNRRTSGGEEIGDLAITFSALKGIEVPPERAPSMIDEYPVLAVAAAFAEGRTVMRGLEELVMKESDRLAATAAALRACGVEVEATGSTLVVEGRGADGVHGGALIATQMDHRIAMAFLVLGLASRETVSVDDISMVATSFPGFESAMGALGANLARPNR